VRRRSSSSPPDSWRPAIAASSSACCARSSASTAARCASRCACGRRSNETSGDLPIWRFTAGAVIFRIGDGDGTGGLWRSLVAHCTGGAGVAGSNPVSPTVERPGGVRPGVFVSCGDCGVKGFRSMRSIGHRIGPRGSSRWLELAGVLGAVLLGAIAVSLLLGTPRAENLFFGADSTVMPLVQRSIEDGEPFQWRMTSTIFAVEIPIFALLSLVVKGVFTRVLVSGIVNYVLLYLMLRWIAGVLGARLSRPVKIGVGLIGVAIPALMVALEVTWTVRTIEFASMLLSTSYYYPVLIGMFAAVAMVARMMQVPGRAQAGFAVALGVMTAVLVMSNPLFVGRAVAPILGTLFLMLLGRRRGVAWRVLWVATLATGVGM